MPSSAPKSAILSQVYSSFSQGTNPLVEETQPTTASPAVLSVNDQLDTLEQVLNDLEPSIAAATPPQILPTSPVEPASSFVPAAVPLAVLSATDTLNPPAGTPATTAKESLAAAAPERIQVDVGSGLQAVESEPPANELPVEVEGFLQEVKQNQEQLPHEIVIAGDTAQLQQVTPPRPVIVLPITEDVEKAGRRKGTQWSVRWLVEWSRRLMKMFKGDVVYANETKT